MASIDIEKLIGSPINFSTGDEYYQTSTNDEYADDEMSDNSIEYCDSYNDNEIQQQINCFIENLKFMSLNENKIILYQPSQPPQDYSIIQMEF